MSGTFSQNFLARCRSTRYSSAVADPTDEGWLVLVKLEIHTQMLEIKVYKRVMLKLTIPLGAIGSHHEKSQMRFLRVDTTPTKYS
jgi:hypothetical protein